MEEKIKLRSEILEKIRDIKRWSGINSVYWIIYNFYFGWNLKPLTRAEEICDTIFIVLWCVIVINILQVFLRYIEFKMYKYLREFND